MLYNPPTYAGSYPAAGLINFTAGLPGKGFPMSRVLTNVGPLKLFGQTVPGFSVAKSGDSVVALMRNDGGKTRTLDGKLSQAERCRVYRALKKAK